MNPLRLKATNLGRFTSLDVDFPSGCVAVVGPNGAGKSTLLNAIELALFADGSRDLASCLSPWADRLELELTFDHAGETYRVRQGYKVGTGGRGTATVDFEIEHTDLGPTAEPKFHPLTGENADATRALIVETLGLSRRTFRASSFLAQGDTAAFPEASPSDRKAILGEILDPRGLWPKLAEQAKARSRAVDQELAGTRTRIADREQTAATIPDLEEANTAALVAVGEAELALARAEGNHTDAQAAVTGNVAAAERHRGAVTARDTAEQARDRAVREHTTAKTEADRLPAARLALEQLDVRVARIPELERLEQEQRDQINEHGAATQKRADADLAVTRQHNRVLEIEREQTQADDRLTAATAEFTHLEQAEDGTARCTQCEQTLGAEGRATSIENLRTKIAELRTQFDEKTAAAREANTLYDELSTTARAIVVPELPPVLPGYSADLADARAAAARREGVAVQIAQFEKHAGELDFLEETVRHAAETLEARETDVRAAAAGMSDPAELEYAVAKAETIVKATRFDLTQAQAEQTRTAERLALAHLAAEELRELRASTAAAQTRLDVLKLAERAYGRDGIPVLLVENVIPQIEAEANRILEQMPTADGVVLNVELVTQREQKNGNVAETLEVIASDNDGPRAYETFSGGERARLNIALRIALARLLAGRRGAESRLLAIDELEYLDTLGQEQLVDVVRGVSSDFDLVMIVSHADVVRDAFDSVIEISKADGVSTIVGTREPALVGA